ncbi:LysB family phage lysis regulatory protein [Escherichia coli]|nr:LysB family phage lysis regulatory protein [Escherichia coli]
MSRLMIVLVVLLSLAVAGLFLAKHENASLRASLDRANNVASGQQTTITMLKNQLHVALTRADKNELAQVALRHQELENAAKREAQLEKTITRLLNENEDFRRWYGADLPDVVRRLHQRPACTDASDCPQRLPESEPLSDAGQ